MPIEIKELHIKINVNEDSKAASKPANSGKEKDVAAVCVEQVMKVIERKKER
jgi:Family of unknown function (DUF5908)